MAERILNEKKFKEQTPEMQEIIQKHIDDALMKRFSEKTIEEVYHSYLEEDIEDAISDYFEDENTPQFIKDVSMLNPHAPMSPWEMAFGGGYYGVDDGYEEEEEEEDDYYDEDEDDEDDEDDRPLEAEWLSFDSEEGKAVLRAYYGYRKRLDEIEKEKEEMRRLAREKREQEEIQKAEEENQ